MNKFLFRLVIIFFFITVFCFNDVKILRADSTADNFAACENLSNLSEKELCYGASNSSLTDPMKCDLIKEKESVYKNDCLSAVAANTNKFEVCYKINNKDYRKECYQGMKNRLKKECSAIQSSDVRKDCADLTKIVYKVIKIDRGVVACNKNNETNISYKIMGASDKAWDCFNANLKKCKPAIIFGRYIIRDSLPPQQIYYKIFGKDGKNCKVSGPAIDWFNAKVTAGTCSLKDAGIKDYSKNSSNNMFNGKYFSQYLITDVLAPGNNPNRNKYCAK